VSWNGAAFALYEPLAGWPLSSTVDGASPRSEIPASWRATLITSTRPVFPQLDLSDVILCGRQLLRRGLRTTGIYEGTIGTWYSHTSIDCNDGGAPLTEQITPSAGSRYYLVVPRNSLVEGLLRQRRDARAAVHGASRGCSAVRRGADRDSLSVRFSGRGGR
jgi:hypothetical protein